MLQVKIAGKHYELADTLRVVYSLKDITGAKSMQEALSSLAKLDLDKQIKLLYAAYKAAKTNPAMSLDAFRDLLIDNCGVFAVTNMVNDLANGLLYSGLDTGEAESKKAAIVEALKAGVTSSAMDSESD